MQNINIDASAWKNILDFNFDLKRALGSPAGHGDGIYAFIDSIGYGGMNAINPPFQLNILNLANVPVKTKQEIIEMLEFIQNAISKDRNTISKDKSANDIIVRIRF